MIFFDNSCTLCLGPWFPLLLWLHYISLWKLVVSRLVWLASQQNVRRRLSYVVHRNRVEVSSALDAILARILLDEDWSSLVWLTQFNDILCIVLLFFFGQFNLVVQVYVEIIKLIQSVLISLLVLSVCFIVIIHANSLRWCASLWSRSLTWQLFVHQTALSTVVVRYAFSIWMVVYYFLLPFCQRWRWSERCCIWIQLLVDVSMQGLYLAVTWCQFLCFDDAFQGFLESSLRNINQCQIDQDIDFLIIFSSLNFQSEPTSIWNLALGLLQVFFSLNKVVLLHHDNS